mmetsp:Transcript_55526/g.161271  ORF Transcript_55526/g.161271 Transcript_55526/m.161271 type:complete len:267 (-) Transcript_55526:2044-2844(-)
MHTMQVGCMPENGPSGSHLRLGQELVVVRVGRLEASGVASHLLEACALVEAEAEGEVRPTAFPGDVGASLGRKLPRRGAVVLCRVQVDCGAVRRFDAPLLPRQKPPGVHLRLVLRLEGGRHGVRAHLGQDLVQRLVHLHLRRGPSHALAADAASATAAAVELLRRAEAHALGLAVGLRAGEGFLRAVRRVDDHLARAVGRAAADRGDGGATARLDRRLADDVGVARLQGPVIGAHVADEGLLPLLERLRAHDQQEVGFRRLADQLV